jgi:hypothetical protein
MRDRITNATAYYGKNKDCCYRTNVNNFHVLPQDTNIDKSFLSSLNQALETLSSRLQIFSHSR